MSDVFSPPTCDLVRVVKVIQETGGSPGSFPNGILKVYKCLPCTVTFSEVEGSNVTITPAVNVDRAIYCGNFRHNYIVLNAFYMVFCINGLYVLDNQAAFLEAL